MSLLSQPRLFTPKPLAWAIWTSTLLATTPTWAANNTVNWQEKIIQLQHELDIAQQALQLEQQQTHTADNPNKSLAETTTLEAIVVKHKRKQTLEKVQDVPSSISVVSGEDLERLNATTITEVLRRVGNVNFNYGNPRTGSLTLRGITTGSSDQIDPTVGAVLDGVSLGYTPLVNGYVFIDLDTVDVTRGPQGTQGGKPSNIGRITFKTKEPTFTPEAQISQTFGQWNTLQTTAIVGGPVVDGLLAWRGSFQRDQSEGPWKNEFPDLKGRGNYQNTDRTFGRVQFLLTPSTDFSAKLSVENQPKGGEFVNGLSIKHPEPVTFSDGVARPSAAIDTTYKKYLRNWFNTDNTYWNTARDYYQYPVYLDNNGSIITSSKGATANLIWHVHQYQIESITGYRNHWFSAANDEGTPFDITKSGGYITEYSQLSQELRLSSDKGNKIDYATGLYFLSTDNDSLGSRTRYGSDAGAFQASDALYNSLSTSAVGQTLLRDSLNQAYKSTQAYVKNKSAAIYANADWHLTEPVTLSAGYRLSHEQRRTEQGVLLLDAGVGADFTTAFGNSATTTGLVATGGEAADRLAQRYFGSTWSSLSTSQQNLLRDAARVRNGTLTPASLYAVKAAPTWEGNLTNWNVSIANIFTPQLTGYSTVQYGEKGGMSQIAANGTTSLVDKEQTTGYELGLRSNWLDRTLILNVDVFLNNLKNFQTTINLPDPVATAAYKASNPSVSDADAQQYQSVVGNLPKVVVKGLELDAAYTGIKNLTLNVAAAYNDARYGAETWLAKPNEIDSTAKVFQKYYNAKGEVLNNAPKVTANLGVDYRLPVFSDKVFHTSANYKYTSSYHTSPSSYDVFKAYGLLDLGVGIGRKDGAFDVNVVAKNVLNASYHVEGWSSYTPSLPRWLGVTFSAKI